MRNKDKCMDSQLWHACAGGMVQLPEENSKVYYFPQGHAEHAQGFVDFENTLQIPPFILCRVTAVKFMSDRETDEVFAKIQMVPIRYSDPDDSEDRFDLGLNESDAQNAQVKPVSFAKTLTQSDANNGGGFSVPRYCAETIFPRLDYSANPPLQTLIVKDVHGEVWKFRHIYRGTPRRHLLTTGWGTFVNKKRLVAGDSIVFLKADNGDLCIGIRRARKGGIGYGPETASQLNLPSGVGASDILREENIRFMRSSCANFVSSGVMRGRSCLRADSVIEAATLAASGHPFEVVYYPRASTPEFCIKAAAVRVATRIQWFAGMRFKMAFETEDSSRISWFMGTISSVQVVDPKRWPDSPWRLLQVIWDEPDLLQNVKCVSPWLVELVSHMPTIDLAQFTPTSKKRRISQHLDCHFDGKIPLPMIHGTPLWSSDSPIPYGTGNAPAAGIKGARHANYGLSLSDLRLNKLQTSLCYPGFDQIDHATPHSRISTGVIVGNGSIHDNVSCLLTIGHPSESQKRSQDGELPRLVLFGQPIFIADELSLSKPEDTFSFCANRNRSSDRNLVTVGLSNDYGSAIDQKGLFETLSCGKDHQSSELGLETGHCKIFMESEDVGRTLDLTVFGSYEELYERLTDMFGIQKSDMMFHVLYKDAAGAVKHTGDQPFSDFMKTARRLTILTDSES